MTLAKEHYLAYYATIFNTVEVNTSFYALPKPATLIKWLDQVPPHFTFALKVPREITHEKRLHNCEQETLAYLDAVRSLGDAAGPGLLQFPPNFTRTRYGHALARYLDWLATEAQDLRMAVEVRSADLMTPAFAKFVAERGMALVLVDRVNTPDLSDVWYKLCQEESDSPTFTFIRWIGDDKNTPPKGDPTKNREIIKPQDAMLQAWANRIATFAAVNPNHTIYGYMHNPYEGHSPASLHRLFAYLEDYSNIPPWPPEGWQPAFEQVSEDADTSGEVPASPQLSLFG